MSDTSTFIDSALSDGTSVASEIRLGLLASLGKTRRKTIVRYTTGPQTLTEVVDLVTCDAAGGSFTVNLLASPADGDTYTFKKETAGNTLTVGRNGKNIEMAAADQTLTSALSTLTLTWSSAANSWLAT